MFALLHGFSERPLEGLFDPVVALRDALRPFTTTGGGDVHADKGTWSLLSPLQGLERPLLCQETGRTLVAWARLDNRKELQHALAVPRDCPGGDSALILAAWARWGEACVSRLTGEFAFAIHDPDERLLFAARDPLGCRPLWYQERGNYLALATSPTLFHHLDGSPAPDEAWLARYLLGLSAARETTPWRSVRKVPPGHLLSVRDGRVSLRRFHRFEVATEGSPASWVEAYRERLEEAVRCRLEPGAPAIGCESSGGIDSSTILGFAARSLSDSPVELHAFGDIALNEEPAYILETSLYHGLKHNHVFSEPITAQGTEGLERVLASLGQPPEHASVLRYQQFLELAQRLGIRVLLSGFGGDEAVTSQAGQAPIEVLDSEGLLALLPLLPGNRVTRLPQLARWLARRYADPEDTRRSKRFRERQESLLPLAFLRPEAVDSALREAWLSDQEFAPSSRTVNGAALSLLGSAYLPTRLEQSSVVARSFGVEYRWPLLDQQLIAQWLATPAREKWCSGYGRYLHRRAAAGVVPEKVLWKQSKRIGDFIRSPQEPAHHRAMVSTAKRLIAELHPALDPLVDRDRMGAQVRRVDHGKGIVGRAEFQFHFNVRKVLFLDTWLKMYYA